MFLTKFLSIFWGWGGGCRMLATTSWDWKTVQMFEKYKSVQCSSVTKRTKIFLYYQFQSWQIWPFPVLWGGAGGGGGVCRKSLRDGAAVAWKRGVFAQDRAEDDFLRASDIRSLLEQSVNFLRKMWSARPEVELRFFPWFLLLNI